MTRTAPRGKLWGITAPAYTVGRPTPDVVVFVIATGFCGGLVIVQRVWVDQRFAWSRIGGMRSPGRRWERMWAVWIIERVVGV